jgi:hypothetical protein
MNPDENAKQQVLRDKLKWRSGQSLLAIVDSTGISREQLIAFRRGGTLSVPALTRLTSRLLHGETDSYWGKVIE